MALKTQQVVGKGCMTMGILAEDDQGNPNPPKSELDAWIQSATSPNTWVLNSQSPQPDAEIVFGTNIRDTWAIVDLATMKVLHISTGDEPTVMAMLQSMCQ